MSTVAVPVRFERAISIGRTASSRSLSRRLARSRRRLLGTGSKATTDEKPAWRAANTAVPTFAPISTNVVRGIRIPAASSRSSAFTRTLRSLSFSLLTKRLPSVGSFVGRTKRSPSRSGTT
jgi:hypothetical protein